ncbi:MAG TPA: MAPEG family protein [Caulobacteraceae bacterium]
MSELICLELALVLWFAHLFCQMGTAGRAFSTAYLFSSRDAQPPPKGVLWGRATRAFTNYVENLVAFAALDLGLIVTHHAAGFAPTVWIIARAIYLPLYLFNVVYVRTFAAGVAMISLLVMVWGLAGR